MKLRPVPARWFEVIIPRIDSPRAASILARTGLVELEGVEERGRPVALDDLQERLARYRELRRAYGRYWARGALDHTRLWASPGEILEQALSRLEAWRAQADPLVERLQGLEADAANLLLWEQVLRCAGKRDLNLSALASSGPVLETLLVILPGDVRLDVPDSALVVTMSQEHRTCLLMVGMAKDMKTLRHEVRLVKGRLLEWPAWLRGDARDALPGVAERRGGVQRETDGLYRDLDRLYDNLVLGEVLGDLVSLEWFSAKVGELPVTGQLAWITGWTSDIRGTQLERALDDAGARALVHFPPAPVGAKPPQLMRNPAWIRPFEIFVRGLGVPGRDEVDPSPLLAVLVPLLFGYMFGDLGQGLLLAVLGWFLQRRWTIARLLIPAGLSAAMFGLLYGSVFSHEGLLPPLWLNPLHEPLTVLWVPLVLAVFLLSLGQVLNALEAAWRGAFRDWWFKDAGLLVLYLGAAGSVVTSLAQPVAILGLVWFLSGRAWLERSLKGLFSAVGNLAEDGLRLLVNTISFARVGAFALAHAGLSSALMTLVGAADSPLVAALVMVLGNVVIILLEALVVSVQTTRLILFEFFVRFLRAEGRAFKPLHPPTSVIEGESYETTS